MPPLVRSHSSGVHPRACYLGEMAGSEASNKTCRKGLRRLHGETREALPVSGPRGANSFVASHERPHGRVTVSARPISPEYLGVFGT
jgi:hypothetical protein